MAGITNDCVLLNLQLGVWAGYKLDKSQTRKVIEDTGAAADALRVNKHLMPKEVLQPIMTAANAIRIKFYKETLPWKDNGDRLLPRKMFMKYIPEHAELVKMFDDAVEVFLAEGYPRALEQAEFRMGESYNPSDYPAAGALRKTFYVNLDVDAIPQAKDFRLKDDASILQKRVDRAMLGLWEKLAEPLEALMNGLASENGRGFKTATLNNVKAIQAMLPELNFTHSEELEKINESIDKRITRWEAEDLRGADKDDVRKAIAGDAADILKTMKGFMTAMGGAA